VPTSDAPESATATQWRTVHKLYRRPPGFAWLLALVLIPLFLGVIGYKGLEKSESVAEHKVEPSATLSAPGEAAVLVIRRNGSDVTLTGAVPDDSARSALNETVKTALGPTTNVIDQTSIDSSTKAPNLAAIGVVLAGGAGIPDLGIKVGAGTVTLTGTAPGNPARVAVEDVAKTAWPRLSIDNQVHTLGAPNPPTDNASVPASTAAAAAAAPAVCPGLQTEINALLIAPINFDSGGSVLTPNSQQTLATVAEKIKGCPTAHIAVTGYTDTSGDDSLNGPLSADRARSVADYLVSQGIPDGAVSSQGLGSANPIATNDTPEGRSVNRRVEITVS
jgi:peptidoglycan-binding protein ArfA